MKKDKRFQKSPYSNFHKIVCVVVWCLFISIGCAQIDSPENGSTFTEGETITFIGSVLFDEEEIPTASRYWHSNIDGQIGSGALVQSTDLSVGTHTITLTVPKNNWKSYQGNDTITITVLSQCNGTMDNASAAFFGKKDPKYPLR